MRALSSSSSSDLTLSANDVPPPVPVALKTLQLVLWNISCLAPLIAVTIYWGAVVSSVLCVCVLAQRFELALESHIAG